MQKILKSYLKRLTDLTGANRSILLLRLAGDQFIDVHKFSYLNGSKSFSIIESLITQKSQQTLCPVMDSRDEDVNLMSTKLRRLKRAEEFIFEERGSRDLFVAWPFLRGKLSDGTPVRAPLLLFPTEIEIKDNQWVLKPKKDVGITLNKAFLLAYAHFNKIKLEDEFIERGLEDFEPDTTVFRTGLYQLFKDSPVEFNFNPENFQDELTSFKNFKKPDFEANEKNGELKLYPEAVLGIFPQSGSQLVPDYKELLDAQRFGDLEDFFAKKTLLEEDPEAIKTDHTYFLNRVTEERTFTPFKMDAYQENALKAIKKGNSIVVQGPPGTGKSQLISNIIGDHIARGKKVLLVCQKRAALDVVYRRLEEQILTDFVGLVHDFKDDRKHLYQKITRQIDRIDEYKHKNNGLDAIQLERRFLQISRRIDQITEEMEEFKFALFDESECGLSVKELYLTSNINKPSESIRMDYKHFHFDAVPDFASRIRRYAWYSGLYDLTNYPLRNRKSFSGYGLSEMKALKEVLGEIPSYQEWVKKEVKKIVGSELNLEDCLSILSKRHYVVEMLGILKHEEAYRYFRHIMGSPDRETDNLWLSNVERVIMACYHGEGPEVSLGSDQLGKFQEALQRTTEARKGLVKLIHWELFSRDKKFIKKVLVANGLKRNKEGFRKLIDKIDNRLNLEHNFTKLRGMAWLMEIPTSYEKGRLQQWFQIQKLAVKAKLVFNSLRNFKEFFYVSNMEYVELKEKIEKLFEIIKEIPDKHAQWEVYLTPQQINNIIYAPELADDMAKALHKDFDALCEFDSLKEDLQPHEKNVIGKIFDERTPSEDEAESIFQNSIRLAWIEHIETKYPILRTVSSMKFQKLEAELQQSVKEKLQISNEILLLKAREQTYEDVEYNRLNNRITYRELHHQVSKKRRIWPLRKLLAHYHQEIFNLLPCWMASPESVSAIFPMEGIFDVVIFDEASQCFAERGVPAMYRGRQVVIAGDDKQLRPSDIYKIRVDEEEEEPDLEVDSLLELANRYLMSVQLQGHYRSKSLELIEFSNQHFYEGKLRLLPDFSIINTNEPAIDFIKVDGIWQNNTNPAEAEKVLEILVNLIRNEPIKEIGVVTFNAKQQSLILDLLDEWSLKEGVQIPPTLFVKNIENVQGDEKDVIVFSTGYGPNEKGKIILQFGSLNAVNGENRLNVAVTRAREKVMVVSSLYPQQLKVEDTKNEGPKLLKEYLQYAIHVSENKYKLSLPPHQQHHATWYLKDKIKSWSMNIPKNFEMAEELPFADLTVRQNGDYIGLLLTDDNLYHESVSIKEAHVYKPFTLSQKNWKFKGIFSREFWMDAERIEESIVRFVNQNSQHKE